VVIQASCFLVSSPATDGHKRGRNLTRQIKAVGAEELVETGKRTPVELIFWADSIQS